MDLARVTRGRPRQGRLRVGSFVVAVVVAGLAVGGALGASGGLDGSFGTGGKVLTDLGAASSDGANAIAVQKDGKLVVVGYSDARGDEDFALTRYRRSGALDGSFGAGGKVLTGFPGLGSGSQDAADAVAVQSDGKIVVAGYSDAHGSRDFALARYRGSGALDRSFGAGGKVLTDLRSRSQDRVVGVALQRDGKIVVAGPSMAHGSSNFALARYSKGGSLDRSFGSRGKVLTDLGSASYDYPGAMAVQKDGKIVLAGYSNAHGSYDFALVRYLKSGAIDRSFGSRGKVLTDLGSASVDQAFAMAVQQDGKIVLAGYSTANGGDDFALVRYTRSGKLDTGWGPGGKVLTDVGSGGTASALAVQNDGKIVVAGYGGATGGIDFALARYWPSGFLDAGFGSGGVVLTDLGSASSEAAYAMAVQTGKIIAAGNSNANGSDDFAVVRYLG